jgi:hypothetical protein
MVSPRSLFFCLDQASIVEAAITAVVLTGLHPSLATRANGDQTSAAALTDLDRGGVLMAAPVAVPVGVAEAGVAGAALVAEEHLHFQPGPTPGAVLALCRWGIVSEVLLSHSSGVTPLVHAPLSDVYFTAIIVPHASPPGNGQCLKVLEVEEP